MDALHVFLVVALLASLVWVFVMLQKLQKIRGLLLVNHDELQKNEQEKMRFRQDAIRLQARFDERLAEQKDFTEKSKDLIHQRDTCKVELKESQTRFFEERGALMNQVDHLRTQLRAVTRQITEIDQENAQLRSSVAKESEQKQQQLAAERVALQEQLGELKHLRAKAEQRAQEAERKLAALLSRLEQFDPAEAGRLKRKLQQYNQIFASMRGLKEMAEERSQNWELALRKLATHVLGHEAAATQGTLGEMVGRALEKIRANFHEDELLGLSNSVSSANRNTGSESSSSESNSL